MFADDKRQLWAWKRAIEERMARYRLTIHPGAHPRPVEEGIPFLGFMVYPDQRRVKRRKGIHYQQRLRRQLRSYKDGALPVESFAASIQGWDNHVRYANSVGLRKALLSSVPAQVMERVVTDLPRDEPAPTPKN